MDLTLTNFKNLCLPLFNSHNDEKNIEEEGCHRQDRPTGPPPVNSRYNLVRYVVIFRYKIKNIDRKRNTQKDRWQSKK